MIKRFLFAAIFGAAALAAGGPSLALSADDIRWITQCVRDSASYPVSDEVKLSYCTCMVSRMADSERRSVTQWEQANPGIARDCARRAGWN